MRLGDVLEYVGWCQPISIVRGDDVLYEGGCGDRPFEWDGCELELYGDGGIGTARETLVLRIGD